MTLPQILEETARLNRDNATEWQYVAYARTLQNHAVFHVLLIPLGNGAYSLEVTPVGGHDIRSVVTLDTLPFWVRNIRDSWEIWKWLPDEERRIFKSAEEAMVRESR